MIPIIQRKNKYKMYSFDIVKSFCQTLLIICRLISLKIEAVYIDLLPNCKTKNIEPWWNCWHIGIKTELKFALEELKISEVTCVNEKNLESYSCITLISGLRHVLLTMIIILDWNDEVLISQKGSKLAE